MALIGRRVEIAEGYHMLSETGASDGFRCDCIRNHKEISAYSLLAVCDTGLALSLGSLGFAAFGLQIQRKNYRE